MSVTPRILVQPTDAANMLTLPIPATVMQTTPVSTAHRGCF
jgi:hypothetical protein